MRIVGHRYARREKHIVFYHGELRDVHAAMHADATAKGTPIVDDRIVPDVEAVANHILLSDHNVVPRLQTSTDSGARIDNGTAANLGTGADAQSVVVNASAGELSQENSWPN